MSRRLALTLLGLEVALPASGAVLRSTRSSAASDGVEVAKAPWAATWSHLQNWSDDNSAHLLSVTPPPLTAEERCRGVSCPAGLECGVQGGCVPQVWGAAAVCLDPQSSACRELVADVTYASRAWLFIITSSGGSGHLIAAKNLEEDYATMWGGMMERAAARLETNRSLLTQDGFAKLSTTLTQVRRGAPPVGKLDIMLSPCMSMFGKHGSTIGKIMTEVWNDQQHNGHLDSLNQMTEMQGLVDSLFSPSCYQFLKDTLLGNRMNFTGIPTHVISVQPVHLMSIAKAIADIRYERRVPLVLDEYITELPTEENKAFFDPILALNQDDWHSAQNLRLHIVDIGGDYELVTGRTGLDTSQLVIEPYGPVSHVFRDGSLPRPGTETSIVIRAQIPEEASFLGAQELAFHIEAKDTVTLIMLGSQPTVSAMHEYRKKIIKLAPAPREDGFHYVFLACGDPSKKAYKKIYEKSVKEAQTFNKKQRQSGSRVRMVPFTKQAVPWLQGRADVTLTRSGGMTCFELLALAKRGDRRTILLHVETPEFKSPILFREFVVVPGDEATTYDAWREKALKEGMLSWEMGNAKYLMSKLGAQIVVPSLLRATHFH